MRKDSSIVDSAAGIQMLRELCAGFEASVVGRHTDGSPDSIADVVGIDELPDSYRRLLAHDRHMTATLRERFGGELTLHVLAHRTDGLVYRRCIELALARTGAVVEIGVIRLDTAALDHATRAAVLEGRRPLGDILVGSGVLTRVDVRWYLRFVRGDGLVRSLAGRSALPVYGRLATIHCNGSPALELLEIVTDDPEVGTG